MRGPTVGLTALAALAFGACATSGSSASPGAASASQSAPEARRGNANLIVQAEVVASNTSTAQELIQRLRPTWLRSRGMSSARPTNSAGESSGTLPVVYLDNSVLGEISTLANVPTANIAQVQYLSANEATQRFGTGYTGGAIIITTRK